MTAQLCIHCQVPPTRRQQTGTAFVMWICPVCNNRGEATPSEARALSSWQLVNDPDMPPHTCKAKEQPRFFMRDAKWGSRCAGCDFVDHGYATIEGARAGWTRATR